MLMQSKPTASTRRFRLQLLGVLTASALTGCSLAPDLPATPAAVPTQYAAAPLGTQHTAVPTWQTFFQDPRLQQLLTQALAQNQDLRLAVLNVDRVRSVSGFPLRNAVSTMRVGAARRFATNCSIAVMRSPSSLAAPSRLHPPRTGSLCP